MNTDMNVYNADNSRNCDFREQRKVLQGEPITNMNLYNADLSHQKHFGEHLSKMPEPNTYSDMNDVYTDLRYHRDIIEQRRKMQEANTLHDMNVHAQLCRHRGLDEQLRKMPKPSDVLNKALDAISTIVDCVALVAEEEDNVNMNNMNMNMNTASTTTNDNCPSNNHNLMLNNNIRSSSPPLLSSSMDFQQHIHQLQQQQQIKHELDQLQKWQQELVQMMNTNTTTMTQTHNNSYAQMSMPMSQIKQEKEKEHQQQLQSSTTIATIITPPITKKKTVNLGKINFIIDLTEEAEPTRTTVDNTTTTAPSESYILLGRGKGVENHTGNIYYRKVVESFRKQYESIAHKGCKSKFIRDVVDIIHDNGHQFVKKVKDPNPRNGFATSACTSTWVLVDLSVAREKVSHSFRNAKRLQIIASASTNASSNNKYKLKVVE